MTMHNTKDQYYQEMESIWASNYPSVSSIEKIETFYKECGIDVSIEELLDQIMNHPSLIRNHNRILDFGCDNGIMLYYFKKYKLELFGIDINGKSIEAGHRLFPELNLIKSEGLDIPFCDDYFDIVYASAVLKHIRHQDRDKIYQEFSRVARYIVVWEKNSAKKAIEESEGFKFYHSNFKEELKSFFRCHKLIEISSDILGLYERR